MKCTELVLQGHAVLRRGLNILDGMMDKLEGGERIEIADVNAVLKFFKVFAQEYHQTIEETILFPALLRTIPPDSPIHQLVVEHAEERALVAWISESLAARKMADFVFASRRLSAMLKHHFEIEDAILVHLSARLLSEEEDDAVTTKFMNNHKDPNTFLSFPRLERKYTPKPPEIPLDTGQEVARRHRASVPN